MVVGRLPSVYCCGVCRGERDKNRAVSTDAAVGLSSSAVSNGSQNCLTPHRTPATSWSREARSSRSARAPCLNGSSFGGSCLELGWVGFGLHLEFHAGDQGIITSHVRAIAVEPPTTGAPC